MMVNSIPLVIPNLFRDNTLPSLVILKRVQDDEFAVGASKQ
jgi:hypothetical protein